MLDICLELPPEVPVNSTALRYDVSLECISMYSELLSLQIRFITHSEVLRTLATLGYDVSL
jgi:hypothetical protein